MWTTLGEVGTWQSGGTPSRSNKTFYGGNIPWLKTGDLNDGLISDIPESITEEAVANSSAKINPTGSVLIAMYGATMGKLGILTFPATTNQACCACIEFHAITQLYLFYFLLSQRNEFIAKGGGGAQPNISKEIIVNTFIPLPPLSEQQRIVIEIEKWFALIDQIEHGKDDMQSIIKQAKSKILDLAIHGKLVPQDPNDEPAIALLKRINPGFTPCDNGHSEKLPNGWVISTLGTIGDWQSGGTPRRSYKQYYSGNIPWLKISDLTDDYIMAVSESITQEAIDSSSAKINPQGSIAIAMYGSIGKVGILTFPAATNQAVCVCKQFRGIDSIYLFYYLISQREAFIRKSGGGVQANISKDIIIKHFIYLPPLAEQQRIVHKIEELFSVLNNIQKALEA